MRVFVYYTQKRLGFVNIISVRIEGRSVDAEGIHSCVYQKKEKKKEKGELLAGGFDVDFYLVLCAGGENGYTACNAYVLNRYAAWILYVDF